MDLSGHHHFRAASEAASRAGADQQGACRIGEMLLASAWASLSSTQVEAVDIHLRSGQIVRNAVAVRMDGEMGEASCRVGHWTHAFAVQDIVLVNRIPRGPRS